MSQAPKDKWNSKANELFKTLEEGEICFIRKKVRGGCTWSVIINALSNDLNVVVVEPTHKLIIDEVDKIVEEAKNNYDLQIEESEFIRWLGKKKGCRLEEDNDEYPYGKFSCLNRDCAKNCKVKKARKRIIDRDWRILALTLSKFESIYQMREILPQFKDAFEEIQKRADIVLIDECRYLTSTSSFFEIKNDHSVEDFISRKCANSIRATLSKNKYSSIGIDPEIGYKALRALPEIIMLEKHFPLSDDKKKVKRLENKEKFDGSSLYEAILLAKRENDFQYPKVLNLTDLFSRDKIIKYENGKYFVRPSTLDRWKQRGEIIKSLVENKATVLLSDATNRVDDIKKCLGIRDFSTYKWGDPVGISKTNLIVYDDRTDGKSVFNPTNEGDENLKKKIKNLIWKLSDLTNYNQLVVNLNIENYEKIENDWNLPQRTTCTYYRSDLCTGIQFDGRVALFLGLPHTPQDAFRGESFERLEGSSDYSYTDKIDETDFLGDNIEEYLKDRNQREVEEKELSKKLRIQEMTEQFIQSSGRVIDPTGEEKSVLISLFTKERMLKKLFDNTEKKERPKFAKTLIDGHHEKDALTITIAWRNDIFEKCGIESSFGVYARLYNYAKNHDLNGILPSLSQALRTWENRERWKKANQQYKKKLKNFLQRMEQQEVSFQ